MRLVLLIHTVLIVSLRTIAASGGGALRARNEKVGGARVEVDLPRLCVFANAGDDVPVVELCPYVKLSIFVQGAVAHLIVDAIRNGVLQLF